MITKSEWPSRNAFGKIIERMQLYLYKGVILTEDNLATRRGKEIENVVSVSLFNIYSLNVILLNLYEE
jgi:hypothetical protein